MKTFAILAFLSFSTIAANAMSWNSSPKTDSDWEWILDRIAHVESNSRDGIVIIDKNGQRAYGRLQIHSVYLADSRTTYTIADVLVSKAASYAVAKAYLTRYGKRYEELTGQEATAEILVRIHNGGPNGYKKNATIQYLRKVKNARIS